MIRKLAVALLVTVALTACADKPKPLPPDVPTVTEKVGIPTGFKKTKSTPAKVARTRAVVVTEGKGVTLKDTDSIVAQYVGQVYPDGTVFDTSFDNGQAANFPLASVIPCWRDQLAGQKVGSRVILLCQAKDAYGDTPPPGSGIKAGDDLMFLVDIINVG